MKLRTGPLTSGVLAAALALGLGGPALASNSGSGGTGSTSGSSAQDSGQRVTDQELQKFAAAYSDIRSVRAEYVPKLQEAKGKQEKAKLRKQGQQEMVKAIRSNDMKVSEYQRIGRKLNNNKELQQRLKQIMQQKQGSSSQGATQQ